MSQHFRVCFFFAFLFALVSAHGESVSFPIVGRFYIDENDSITIYLNGEKLHHSDGGVSQTKEVALRPGDRIVVDLWTHGEHRGIKTLFVSSNRKTTIQFTAGSFRLLHDPDKKDFSEKEFEMWKQPATRVNRSAKDGLTFTNKAEWVWGDKKSGLCYIACLISKEMFRPFEP